MIGETAAGPSTAIPAIQVLDPGVIERIAAGEVVERPVSVVRELLDNAIDAGASEVRVDVRAGGLRLIRVADNGVGIPPEQVELALRHHATSKLRRADDLVGIQSLGFRGEALPSIAAVSEISISSCSGSTSAGVHLDAAFGDLEQRTYMARTRGTTVSVRNLFANVPARLKFMGSARAESAQIGQLIRRYALAHPHVRFKLALDGHPSLETSGAGLRHVATEVFGAVVAGGLLPFGPVDVRFGQWRGLLSGRGMTRSNRQHITLLVNGRSVGSRPLLAAFEDAYRPLLPRGRHPIAVLVLTVPSDRVDVNVHPSKAEVKLRDEAELADELRHVVRDTLGRVLDAPDAQTAYALGAAQIALPRVLGEDGPGWDVATADRLRGSRVHGQVHGSLVLLEDASGLYFVDQHRAHERAIYELLVRRHGEGRAGQLLLEPLHIELSPHQRERLESRLAELASLGFGCEWFGGRSFLVRSVPAIPEAGELASVVEDMLDLAGKDESDWQHRLLTSVACRTATRRGKHLTLVQCRELIALLAATDSPAVCPHGSPTILHFSERFFSRQFGW